MINFLAERTTLWAKSFTVDQRCIMHYQGLVGKERNVNVALLAQVTTNSSSCIFKRANVRRKLFSAKE